MTARVAFLMTALLLNLSPLASAHEHAVCAVYAGPEYPKGLPVGARCVSAQIQGKDMLAQRLVRKGFKDAYRDADGRVWGVLGRGLYDWHRADARCHAKGGRLPSHTELKRALELRLTSYLLPSERPLWSSTRFFDAMFGESARIYTPNGYYGEFFDTATLDQRLATFCVL